MDDKAEIKEYNAIDSKFFLISKNRKLLAKVYDLESAHIVADAFNRAYEPVREPVKIVYAKGKKTMFCPKCKRPLDWIYDFCHFCGQALEWRTGG